MRKFLAKLKNLISKVAHWLNKGMKWFQNMRIVTKLLSGFFLVTILCSTAGIVGINSIRSLMKSDEDMFDKLNSPMVYITYLNQAYFELKYTLLEAAYKNDGYISLVNISKAKEQMSIISDGLKDTWMENELITVNRYNQSIEGFNKVIDKFTTYLKSEDKAEALKYYNNWEFSDAIFNVESSMRDLTSLKIENGKSQLESNRKLGSEALIVMISIIILVMIISIIIGFYISFIISAPIKKLTVIADNIAVGDTTVTPEYFTKDEIGKLSKAFDNMIANIREQSITVEKVGNGETGVYIEPKSENDVLSMGIAQVVNTFEDLMTEINYLLSESKKENFDAVGDVSKFSGRNKEIVEGINRTLEVVREKIFWYEAMLDSIPFPISVTDLDMNLTFVNNASCKLMNAERKDLLGNHCSKWDKAICNTENCGIQCLKRNEMHTIFEQHGHNVQIDATYIYNSKGETIGHIELMQDVTEKFRKAKFREEEVEKLSSNLKLFAEGNLDLNYQVSEGDEYTQDERTIFTEINNNLSSAMDSISSYVREVSFVLSEMSKGNLNLSIVSDYKGDFIEIKNSLNSIINSFNTVFGEVNSTSYQMVAGAKNVAEGSRDLSQGASEQASSVEELTAAIAEVAAQTQNNSYNANQTNELALNVKDNAAEGNTFMTEMLNVMEEINVSCQNISKIIKVIDEIAFQTNILALNASVEAARAGQHGRGFAVVAEEVRNLAARSAEAAKETGSLIENSLGIANKGTKKAQQTYEALNVIVNGVDKASELVAGIAKSSEEQANAIAQINRGIEQVSKVVQTNSATAEESAASSEVFTSHAEHLKKLVSRFVLKDEYMDQIEEAEENTKGYAEKGDEHNTEDFNMIKIDLGENDFGKY